MSSLRFALRTNGGLAERGLQCRGFRSPLSARFGRSWSYKFSSVVSSLVSNLPTVFYPENFDAMSSLFSSLELSRVWSLYRLPFLLLHLFSLFPDASGI